MTAVGTGTARGVNPVVLSTDEIVLGGTAVLSGLHGFTITKYTSAGVLEPAFGTSGATISSIGLNAFATSAAVQSSDGKYVVGGAVSNGASNSFGLARFNIDGTLDLRFGSGGFQTISLGSSSVTIPSGGIATYGFEVAISGLIGSLNGVSMVCQ